MPEAIKREDLVHYRGNLLGRRTAGGRTLHLFVLSRGNAFDRISICNRKPIHQAYKSGAPERAALWSLDADYPHCKACEKKLQELGPHVSPGPQGEDSGG